MPDEASGVHDNFVEWCVGRVLDHVQPGDAFVSKFLFEGTLCFFRLLCPETIHRGNKNRSIRVRITKEVAAEVLAWIKKNLIPLATEWDVHIEVKSFVRNDWVPINAPESQPEPQPFVPRPAAGEVGLDQGIGNASSLVPLTHPVQRLSLEQPQPESQVTIPWELERMARLPESQLGFSPTLNPRPECEEEEEGASIVFSLLYQRNSNPEVASIAKSPVVLLAQHSHDSDESEDEDFYSIGKTGDGEKVDSGNNEDSDDGKSGDGENLDSGNKEDSDDGKTGDGEKLDSGNKEDSNDDLLNRVHRLTECHQSTDNVVERGNKFISRVDVLLQGSKEKSSSTDVSAPLSSSHCEKDAMQPRSDKATKAKTTRRGTTQKAPPTRTSPRAKKRNDAPTRTSPRSKKRTCAAVTAKELSFPSSID
jgi:hypothetical protein